MHAAGTLRAQAAEVARRLRCARAASWACRQSPAPSLSPGLRTRLSLSPRETEVLRLVAAGLSSRRIGEQLALSPHTVAKHLTSIFAKLGVDNRAAATAFAIRHGLA